MSGELSSILISCLWYIFGILCRRPLGNQIRLSSNKKVGTNQVKLRLFRTGLKWHCTTPLSTPALPPRVGVFMQRVERRSALNNGKIIAGYQQAIWRNTLLPALALERDQVQLTWNCGHRSKPGNLVTGTGNRVIAVLHLLHMLLS